MRYVSYKIDFEKIESITEVIFSKPIISLTIILLLGFLLRVFFTPFDLQSRSNDAFVFLLYALEFQNSLDYIGGQYFMWSGLLAIFFIPFHFDNYDGYFTVLEIVSISISTLSGIVLYFIAKKIIHKKFALLATAFFVLEPKILNYISDDSTIWENDPIEKIVNENQLAAYKHTGFYQSMDTSSDKKKLESVWQSEKVPWKVW